MFVAFGDEVGFADTLQGALDQVFGAGASDGTDDGTGTDDGNGSGTEEPSSPGQQEAQQALDTALTKAQQAIKDGQDALAKGDFAAYGQAQEQLAAALEDAVAASRRLAGESATASPDA